MGVAAGKVAFGEGELDEVDFSPRAGALHRRSRNSAGSLMCAGARADIHLPEKRPSFINCLTYRNALDSL